MSILRSLAKIKETKQNAKSKESTCDVDLTNTDSTFSKNTLPSHSETGLGLIDYKAAKDAGTSEEKKARGSYKMYSADQRYKIGKYASEYSTASTLRKYKGEFPQLSESTVRSMRQKYEEELRKALQQKREPRCTLPAGRRGRPLMLGKIDLMVQNYLRVRSVFYMFAIIFL